MPVKNLYEPLFFKSAECSPIFFLYPETNLLRILEGIFYLYYFILLKHFSEPKIASWVLASYDSINAENFYNVLHDSFYILPTFPFLNECVQTEVY